MREMFIRTCFGVTIIFVLMQCATAKKDASAIDRFDLVSRNNVILHAPDTLGALSVGNGEFAFTVDVSGLQTFYKEYENGIPLGTQAQWGWHRTPHDKFSLADVAVKYSSCDSTEAPYAVQHADGRAGDATKVLRANPHRLHLGLIGLSILKTNGEEMKLEDLNKINQRLDLWTGKITSEYEVDGIPVKVVLYSHQSRDEIAVSIDSKLIGVQRLRIKLQFPYGKECHVCPGYDFGNDEKHTTSVVNNQNDYARIKHQLDSTTYFVDLAWKRGRIDQSVTSQTFELIPLSQDHFEFTANFSQIGAVSRGSFTDAERSSIQRWEKFWSTGGAIDFSECTDPRAKELERRVVLSQYLTRIQCAGSMPPQETGLTMNSWFGKFHLEMHWWHAAQFSLWGRDSLLVRSMHWYDDVMSQAKATAQWQGYSGARWQKMTDPDGNESPSNVGAFIIWQQPHPIYFAELLYRNNPTRETLLKYQDIVFNTANFMASFVRKRGDYFHLCRPLIPAQEIFKAKETDDPTFELQYWHYGLSTAQLWRKRLELEEDQHWKAVIDKLAPLPIRDGYYLPNATTPAAYTDDQYRRDHPAVLGAFGFLSGSERMDTVVMRNTFENIKQRWQWETTWGWDYPLMAMTAARLNRPDDAVDALLMNVPKNTYLVNGHNYQDKRLRLYLPGNGGLLAAVAMMAAGWDASSENAPGFPKDGRWNIKWEGLKKMP